MATSIEVYKSNDNDLCLVVVNDKENRVEFAQVYYPVWFAYRGYMTMLNFVDDLTAIAYGDARGDKVWAEWDSLPISGEELEIIRESYELVYEG